MVKKTEEAAATPAVAKTLEERLATAEASVARIKAQIVARDMLNNVEPGDSVTFAYGRKDTARTLSGVVIGVGDGAATQGRVAAIQSGEGIDVTVYKVRVADILTNPTADERNGSTAEEAPASDTASEDPLNEA